MNEIAQGALIGGGLALLGTIITLGFNRWSADQEMKAREREQERQLEERYRIGLYDKCLAVHQQAYAWMIALIEPLQRALELTTGDRDLPDNFPLYGQYAEARQWWFSNCLYLDEKSRACTIDLIENIGAFLRLEERPSFDKVYAIYLEALGAIPAGLGMKHVEATEAAS